MIIVHDICKPDNASKLAKKIRKAIGNSSELANIMTEQEDPGKFSN